MNQSVYKFEKNMLHGSALYITHKKDNAWYGKHWHNYYEMIYYKIGTGSCTLNGEEHPITDNCLFLLTPKDFHRVRVDEGAECDAVIIAFNEQIVDPLLLDLLAQGPFLSDSVPQELSQKLCELDHVFRSEQRNRALYLKHLFNCILLRLTEDALAVPDRGGDVSPIVRESISVMLSDPTADLSLAFFANRFRITEAYFSRLFHKHAGVSFKQYLTALRLEYAKQLLEESRIPIIDVGYECGFHTPSQFFRAFKEAYGMAPSLYRKEKAR